MHSLYKWIVLFGSFIIYLFDSLEISILAFALPEISKDFSIDAVQAGLLASATLVGMGLAGPIMGWLADTYGRKTALIVCIGVFIVLTSVIYIIPTFELLLVIRFIAGIGLGGVWSILSAFVHETWPAKYRGFAVTFVLSAFPVGAIVAAQLSGAMLPDWRMLFLVAGMGGCFALAITVFTFRESTEWALASVDTSSIGKIFRGSYRRITLIASTIATLAFIGYYGVITWLPSYLEHNRGLSSQTVGNYLSWLNLGMFFGYIVFGFIADLIGKRSALCLSLLGVGILMPVYGLVTDRTVLLWLGPLYAFFMTFAGLFGPYLGALYPTAIRATGAGFCFNVGRGISAFAPMILGVIASLASLSVGLIISGILFFIAGVLVLALPKVKETQK